MHDLATVLDELTQNAPPDGATMAAVQAKLTVLPMPAVLLLDDIHLLDSAATACLARLLDRLPGGVHIVTSSRQAPPLELARSQSRAGAAQIDYRDFRFTVDEVTDWLRHAGEIRLGAADVALLAERTEGWAAGLGLAVAGLAQAADPVSFVAGFSGEKRSLHTYFAHTVMAGLPEAQRDFLLATCVLDRLCADLCDALTGRSDGQDRLDALEEAGVFVQQLDEERVWYRHHGLFAAFLRRQLTDTCPGAAAGYHRQARRWYLGRGRPAEALGHAAKAKDPTALASLLDELAESLVLAGDGALIGQYAADLPESVTADFPRLLLALAWLHGLALQCDEADAILHRAEATLRWDR